MTPIKDFPLPKASDLYPRVLITGAEQGLGEVTMTMLKARGHEVFNLHGNIIKLGKVAIEEALMRASEHQSAPFRILINNYGINHLSWIGTTPLEDEEILRVNVMAPYWIVNWFAARSPLPMRVLNIASQTYKVAQRTTALYCASKAALVQMTKVMARELAPRGWIVNAIAPGKIQDTPMAQKTDKQVLELRGWEEDQAETYALQMIPMERFTTRYEVSEAIYKILQMPPYINGTIIDMTGGV